MLKLLYSEGGGVAAFPIEKDEVVLGRSPEADLVLTDVGISRMHAKIVRKDKTYIVVDLNSRNGTKVNETLVTDAPLKDGDVIVLGNFSLEVRSTESEAVEISEGVGESLQEESGTIIRSLDEINKLLQAKEEKGEKPEAKPSVAPASATDTLRSNKILSVLTGVAQTLISSKNLDEILDNVLDIVFANVPAERGVLGLYEFRDGKPDLIPKAFRLRRPKTDAAKIKIPRTITNKVYDDKVSVITMDAMADDRFSHGMSIMMDGVRSCMCVPVWAHDKVIGIIYADSDIQAGSFTEDDLNLMTALGNYAALAIERAKLTEKINEERSIRNRLERYHAPAVIEMLIESSKTTSEVNLVMQEKDVTILFTDLVGFTPLSETLEPQQLALRLNSFFSEMVEAIFKYEGTLDKYIGDCLMAVFGAPIAQEDHAERAVRSAIEMHRQLERLNKDKGFGFKVRTAINSGRVMAGDIGCLKRMEYSVLGDTVNIAARLEQYVAQPDQIVVGENTFERVKDQFNFRHLGRFSLKGKSQKMEAYEVVVQPEGDH